MIIKAINEFFDLNFIKNTVEWITYLENLDYLIEDALKTSLQKSLSALYDVLHGTGKIEPSPFLLIEVILADNEVTKVSDIIQNYICFFSI